MHPHRLDVRSLAAGLLFLGIGGAHLLGGALDWLVVVRAWPVLLVAGGIAVLVGILRSPRDT